MVVKIYIFNSDEPEKYNYIGTVTGVDQIFYGDSKVEIQNKVASLISSRTCKEINIIKEEYHHIDVINDIVTIREIDLN